MRGTIAPHLIPTQPARQFGEGRRCEECNAKISRYTEPQPVTGADLCNVHWRLPYGYYISGSGRVSREPKEPASE